jgi:hypothetical protein
MRHILIVDPLCKKYATYVHADGSTIHQIPSLTLEELPIPQLTGLLFYKLVIYANTKIQQEALAWVLAYLRDTKDDPSSIGS